MPRAGETGRASLGQGCLAARLRLLAPRRAVEDDPGREVVGEALETVLDVRPDEQHVTRAEGDALAADEERAASARDHVELVLVVGRLGIGATRRVVPEFHAAVLHEERR